MRTVDVVRLLLARADSYEVTACRQLKGRLYEVTLKGTRYRAVVLLHSFDFYRSRYHIALTKPQLIICYTHDSALPVPVLSMKMSNLAKPYELPEDIPEDLESLERLRHRKSRVAAQVLLGLYISGTQRGRAMMKNLPPSTRNRYLARVEQLGKRKRGRPVTTEIQEAR